MKKISALVFILFISFLSFAQNKTEYTGKNNKDGYFQFKYPDGTISSEGYIKNGKPDGYWKNYYPNGKIKNEGNRKNFMLDSIWKFYDINGKLTKTIEYKQDKKNGYVKEYDTSGALIFKQKYINDIPTDTAYYYFNTGKLKRLVPYSKGKPHGTFYDFNNDSLIVGIGEYQNGFLLKYEKINQTDEKGNKQGQWKEFYPDGKVKKEIDYRDNKINGYVKEYDKKGNLVNAEKYTFGKKIDNPKEFASVDMYREYYEDGTLKYEGPYVQGYPVGTHYHYKKVFRCDSTLVPRDDTSGVYIKKQICKNKPMPDSAFVYDNGFLIEKGPIDSLRKKQGTWEEYYYTGELKGKGKYKNDLKTGEWMYYYPDGKIEQKGKYVSGKPEGQWIWYYQNGNILREENYFKGKREGELKDYTEDGKILTAGMYIDDKKEGLWIYEIPNYKIIGKYTDGKPDSTWISYYMPSGKIRFKGNFLNGDADGTHYWYYENGNKMMYGNYQGGQKNGEWKFFDETGHNYLNITYENDIEIKWMGQTILPTYEDALKVYENIVENAEKYRQLLKNKKKENNDENDNQ
ncbi:MAG: hypothetical protein KatS3mg028_0706 [Bacteroidia bacterium]|nr:MAG: hypothetical protein KatS3mg028_0706 [Bacteroidia bacterium]